MPDVKLKGPSWKWVDFYTSAISITLFLCTIPIIWRQFCTSLMGKKRCADRFTVGIILIGPVLKKSICYASISQMAQLLFPAVYNFSFKEGWDLLPPPSPHLNLSGRSLPAIKSSEFIYRGRGGRKVGWGCDSDELWWLFPVNRFLFAKSRYGWELSRGLTSQLWGTCLVM